MSRTKSQHDPANTELKPLKPAFDGAVATAGSAPVSDPAPAPVEANTQASVPAPVEHDPADVFRDLDTLRKQSVVPVKRRGVLPPVKVIDKPRCKYFRVHDGKDMSLVCTLIYDKTEDSGKQFYFIHPKLRSHPRLAPLLRWYTMHVIISSFGVVSLWPVPLKREGERDFPVWESYRRARDMALKDWTNMAWDNDQRDYILWPAEGEMGKPKFPDRTMSNYLIEGLAGNIVDNEDHPFVREVRGIID
jgi:hypothetical protein